MMPAIRRARATDLAALQPLEMAAGELFRTVGLDAVADGPPIMMDTLIEALGSRGLWVAVDDTDRPVGFLAALPVDDALHIEEVSVLPSAGRQGVGSRLLATAVEEAIARGLPAVSLSTFRDVPWNAPFYARRGFRVIPPAAWGPALSAKVGGDAIRGLEGSARVVMRRATDREVTRDSG